LITDDNDLPANLAGADITWVMYRQTSKEIILTKTLVSGISIISSGIIDIVLNPIDTTNLVVQQLNHECKIVDLIGPSVVSVGRISILDSVID